MSENVLTFKKDKKDDPSQKMEGFITRYRKLILCTAVTVVAAALVVAGILTMKNHSKNEHLAAIDEIEFNYTNKSEKLTDEELETRRTEALAALESEKGSSGVAAVRASMLEAAVYYEKGDYAQAAASYEAAALADEKAYTAGICFFNAASAYEDAGNKEKAKDLYKKASECSVFIEEPRALVNYARVCDELSLTDEAKTVYQSVIDEYTNTTWAYVAQAGLIKIAAAEK